MCKARRLTCDTAKNALSLISCNNLLQQADFRMRLHGLRRLVTTSLLQVVNRFVKSCEQTCCKQWRSKLDNWGGGHIFIYSSSQTMKTT